MRRLLAIGVVVLLGGCAGDGTGTKTSRGDVGDVGAGGIAGAANWVPKPGLVATVIVMDREKFYELAN